MNSFYALIAVGLDAARIAFSKSKIKETAAAVVVGVGLLVGSTGAVQAECDPPIFDVCFHKSDWTSAGHATMFVEFNPPPAEPGQLYELRWFGLKRLRNVRGIREETYRDVKILGLPASQVSSISYDKFWWPSWITEDSFLTYRVDIYEGHWGYGSDGLEWVRDTRLGSAELYSYQEAAEISLVAPLFPDFDLWKYYCEVDWESPITPLRYGHILGTWTYDNSRREFVYQGVHGSPRFDYQSSCSYEFSPARYVGGFASYSINPYGPPRYP